MMLKEKSSPWARMKYLYDRIQIRESSRKCYNVSADGAGSGETIAGNYKSADED